MPLFSVVICTYNGAHRLGRSVESVLDQDQTDFELVVVDDGSEDNTADVVAKYDSAAVRYVHRPNGGLSAARNTGLEAAFGELVIFLDDDDWVEPTWLSTLASQVAPQTGVVSCACWFENPEDGSSTVVLPTRGSDAFCGVKGLFLAGTFAVRREVYDRIGGYAEGLATCHQTELTLRLLPELERLGLSVRSVDEPLVHIERRRAAKRVRQPGDLLQGTRYILDHHGDQLARSPDVLATYHAIAAVSAFQVGDRAGCRQELWTAVRTHPRNLRHLARFALAFVPPLAMRVWGRHGTMPP